MTAELKSLINLVLIENLVCFCYSWRYGNRNQATFK